MCKNWVKNRIFDGTQCIALNKSFPKFLHIIRTSSLPKVYLKFLPTKRQESMETLIFCCCALQHQRKCVTQSTSRLLAGPSSHDLMTLTIVSFPLRPGDTRQQSSDLKKQQHTIPTSFIIMSIS